MVVGGAVAVSGGDTALHKALNCASVKGSESLRGQATFLQPPKVEEADHFRLSVMYFYCYLKTSYLTRQIS